MGIVQQAMPGMKIDRHGVSRIFSLRWGILRENNNTPYSGMQGTEK